MLQEKFTGNIPSTGKDERIKMALNEK